MRTTLGILLALGVLLVHSSAKAQGARSVLEPEEAIADGEADAEDVAVRGFQARHGDAILRSPPGGQTYVSIVGFSHHTLANEREVGGMLVLGLPFDRVPRRIDRTLLAADRPLLEDAAVREDPAPRPDGLVLTPRLARAAVLAAWRGAGIGESDARLDRIATRARWSGALPETRLRAIRYDDSTLALDTGTETAHLRDSAAANIGFEARLTWRLDRLLYAEDEPALERVRLERQDLRAKTANHVLDALFHWQKAWIDLRALAPMQRGTRDDTDATLRVLEAESALDVLTAGWFTGSRGSSGGGGSGGGGPGGVVPLVLELPRSDL